LKPVFVLLCLTVTLASGLIAAGEGPAPPPGSFVEYLSADEFAPLYMTEVRRLALDEGSVFALREYAGLLQRLGRYEQAAAFADSVGTGTGDMDVIRSLVRVEGLLRRGLDEKAIALIDSLTPAFPSRPLLIELQYFKGNALYNLGRYEESRICLKALQDELEGDLRLSVLYYLARCEEELGNTAEAREIYDEAHEAGLGMGTAGLIRCSLREGEVDAAVDTQREALIKGIDMPRRDIEELLRLTGEADPDLWGSLLALLVADTTYVPTSGVVAEMSAAALRGVDVGAACRIFLLRTGDRERRGRLRYARAILLESGQAAFDSLAAVREGAEARLSLEASAAMLHVAAEDTAIVVRDAPYIQAVTRYLRDAGNPDEMYAWLDLLVRNGLRGNVPSEAGRLREGLVVGFDDRALLDLALLLERAGDRQGALALYREISASPVPSGAAFQSEKRIHLDGLRPPEGQDVSAVIEQVAAEGQSALGLAEVFDERIGDYGKAAEYYSKALAGLPAGHERSLIMLKRGRAFANSYLTGGPASDRDKAMNLASVLAEQDLVDAGDVIDLLVMATDWLELDLFRATEIARLLSARDDLGSGDVHELTRITFRLYERGDAQASNLCAGLIERFLEKYPSDDAAGEVSLLGARLTLAAGDYSGSLEAHEACLGRVSGRTLKRLSNAGIGDCYVGSGGIDKGLEYYGKAGNASAIELRKARCNQVQGAWDRGRIALKRYASFDVSVAARMAGAVSDAASGGLPAVPAFERDCVVPGLRAALAPYGKTLRALDLVALGYDGLALRLLGDSPGAPFEGLHCQILLATYDPLDGRHDEFYAKAAQHFGPNCKDALDVFAHLRLRAEVACAGQADTDCLRSRDLFVQRFPLAAGEADNIDAIRATSLYGEMYVGRADAIADTLFGQGMRSDLLAEAVYRKGVSFLLDKANEQAKQTFLIMKSHFPDSRLYPDVCFKLGTTYYLMEAYDSSAVFFRLAAEEDKVTLLEDALFNLGLALEESGDLSAASGAFFELAARFPFSARFERALMRGGYCLEKNERPMEARDVYRILLKYALDPETRAEGNFWLGECLARAGYHVEAALEFMRTGFFYPGEEAWAGTARYRAGMECESAGLPDAAKLIYMENVSVFGRESTWGKASYEKLAELVGEG